MSDNAKREPTRMEKIKRRYLQCELSYESALGMLEALGMWASDADDYLSQKDDIRAEVRR